MRRRALCASLLLASAGCSKPSPTVDTAFLAADARMQIGGHRVTLPMVALPEASSTPTTFSLDRRASDRASRDEAATLGERLRGPSFAPVDRIQVVTFMYGGYGDLSASRGICPRLRRRWAQAMCADPHDPVIAAMPVNRLWLLDLRRPDLFDNHSTVGGEKVGEQLRSMGDLGAHPSVACDRKVVSQSTRFCTAAMRVDGDLGAVWSVWEGPDTRERAIGMARREGDAIRAFVRHGIGPTEDYERLRAAACRTQRPDRSAQVSGTGALPKACGPVIDSEPTGTSGRASARRCWARTRARPPRRPLPPLPFQ